MSDIDYKEKLSKMKKGTFVSADEAVKVIKSGDIVYIHPGCAFPELLVDAMAKRKDELYDVEVCHLMGVGEAAYTKPEMIGHFRHNAFFIGTNARKAVKEGRADFTPIFLSEVPWLIRNLAKPDVALIQVSVPDNRGFCSFGIGVDCTKAATEVARYIIAQVNPNMPRTLGDSFIHIDKIDFCVFTDVPLKDLAQVDDKSGDDMEIYRKIGQNVAELVEDEATLQMGIGAIPDATLQCLYDRKNLGVHTEMFSDGIVPLVEKGIINCEKKTLLPNKIVTSFILGTRKVFDFVDNNPEVEFRTTEFVNDPFNISRNNKMTAINSALQVDLTGQVCADSIGYSFYSGFGGQVDFLRGAAKSEGGKPIIALPSTAKNGSISRIVMHLTEGAGVTTSRGDVHYVVTEYGYADLHGRTIRERTNMLINIAHPKFRDELEKFAKEHNYL
jgi:4-hydroxybutyrate CoA-transferase